MFYVPNENPAEFSRPGLSESTLKSNLYCYIGTFDSSKYEHVDVENNFDITFDCTSFGEAFRNTLATDLKKTKLCREVSTSSAGSMDLTITGRLEDMDVVNHMGLFGSGPTASGRISYAIQFREELATPAIASETSVKDVRYPSFTGPASFSYAIDAMRMTLAAKTANEIVAHEQVFRLAQSYPLQHDSSQSAVASAAPTITVTSPNISRSVKIQEKGSILTVTGTARSASGVAVVTVNGQEAGLDENGNFWADVMLKVGENRVTVSATGTNRRQKSVSFTVVREAGAPSAAGIVAADGAPVHFSQGKYYALIIGINAYRYIDRLETAVNDAKTIGQILKNDYRFETTLILDQAATRETIMNELNKLRARLEPDDNLLIYYAGHGIHDKVADASYWLPVDARQDNDTNWIDARNVTDQLKRISARHVLVVADSCYSGTMTRSVDSVLKSADTRDSYLSKIRRKAARVLISSGGNEPVSDSGGKAHSIFAEVFINALLGPEKDVFTAEELHVMHIKESVAGRAEQTPEYKIIRNSGHDGGDFIFVKRK